MPNIDLHRAYNSIGDSIHNLFDKTEEGFFVPLYQREYTWEQENIDQFFEDLVLGVQELSKQDSNNAATFLGTVIFTSLDDKTKAVRKGESNAEPTAVQVVIDGQQRISTIALLGIQLTEHLKLLCEKLHKEPPYQILQNHCDDLIKKLLKLYTINLGRGANPPNKPKIISDKEKDRWTYNGDDNNSYHSPIARYIAVYIREEDPEQALNALDSIKGKRVRRNIESICDWLNEVSDAHIPNTRLYGQFPTGDKIVSNRMQKNVLGFNDGGLEGIIRECETDKNRGNYFATAIYHTFLLAHYLLHRCGVNRLQPKNQDWGFDMFQALNATGTPLTAMETFLPQVMQSEEKGGNKWEETQSSKYMNEIDELFKATTSNEQKNKRTNELLNAFALCYEGNKLGNKFSTQRRWITDIYENNLRNLDKKREFLHRLADVGKFFHLAWYMEDNPNYITGLEEHKEGELASFLVRYLKTANSKLSAPILARYYSQALEDEEYMGEFVEAVKSCAAFFTLWRSAQSTTVLDSIYREFFKIDDVSVRVDQNNWPQPKKISSKSLKSYFLRVLKRYDIDEKSMWINESKRFLLYTEVKVICRFVLFLAGHDRVEDQARPGLTVPGKVGVCPLLNLEQWVSKNYKSLEHIAPQNPPENHRWDENIYAENKRHEIGNLLLLRTEVNRIADNKNWTEKFLYYSHVGRRKNEEIKKLREEAKREGVKLSQKAIKELSTTPYTCVVAPILTLGKKGSWDAGMIDRRTQQIKEITWEKLMSWLEDD